MPIERILGTDKGKDAFYKTDRNFVGLEAQINDLDADKVTPHLSDVVTDADGAHGLKVESGIWTPTIIGETTQPTIVYIIQRGTFCKIGKLIKCSFFIRANLTDGDGNLNISGFPVVIKNIDETGIISKASLQANALNYGTLYNITNNSNSARVYKDSYNFAQISEINTNGEFDISGSITYEIA